MPQDYSSRAKKVASRNEGSMMNRMKGMIYSDGYKGGRSNSANDGYGKQVTDVTEKNPDHNRNY